MGSHGTPNPLTSASEVKTYERERERDGSEATSNLEPEEILGHTNNHSSMLSVH